MGESSRRTNDGRTKVYATSQPYGTTTVFTGAGDNILTGVKWAGPKLLFSLLPTDASKSIYLEFSSPVYIKDGYMIVEGAPLGAELSCYVCLPDNTRIGVFVARCPLLGTGWFPLDAEAHSLLPTGLKLEIEVKNSTGINGEEPPAAFRFAGRIELFRVDTL